MTYRTEIISAVSELIGTSFNPGGLQNRALENRPEDVASAIASYPRQLRSLQVEAAKGHASLTFADIEPHEVAHLLVLNRAITGFSSSTMLNKLLPSVLVEIGIRKGKVLANKGPVHPIAALYVEVLGRAQDQAGFDYWLGVLEAGELTLPQIRAAFEGSGEFRARSKGR